MFRIKYYEKKLLVEPVEASDSIILKSNKYFNDDIIDASGEIIESENRTKNHVGYFSTSSVITYGKTKNGRKLYKLTSLDYNLPNFMVSYNGKLKGKMLVVFKYLRWDKKIPQASIVSIIGLFNEENITKAYVYHYDLVLKKNRIKETVNPLENNISRKNIENLFSISIDPEGSKDIDDAISMDEDYLYISIAQPISYMNSDDLAKTSTDRFSTLYLDTHEISLFGDEITTRASLLENQVRNCYTLKFNNLGKLVENFPATIKLNKNLSYSHVNTHRTNFKNLFEFSEKIFGSLENAQKLVEKWMIHSNCIVGKLLNRTIYRNNLTDLSILKDINEDDKKYFYDSSEYHYSDKSNHNILGVSDYVHFTSPIRRMVDNFIHYQLTYKLPLFEGKDLKIFMNNINDLSKRTSKLHRLINLRKILKSLPNISKHLAKVVEINDKYLVLLIPEIGKFKYFFSKYQNIQFNIKLNHIMEIDLGIVNDFYCNKMVVIKTPFDLFDITE